MRHPFAMVPLIEDFVSPSGDVFHTVYAPSFAPDGTIRLTVSDRVDIKREINSHREETDMSFIVSRLLAGDTSVLSAKQPMYGDFTQFPKTYVDMLNIVQAGEDYFNSLPLDVRSKFDNDRYKWFASIGSDDWLSAMGVSRETPPTVDKPSILEPEISVKGVESIES